MTCRELIGFLDEYVADAQSETVRREFEKHLAACRACRDYLKMYRDTITLTRLTRCDPDQPVPGEVPDDLVHAVRAACRSAAKPVRSSSTAEGDAGMLTLETQDGPALDDGTGRAAVSDTRAGWIDSHRGSSPDEQARSTIE